MRQWGITRSDVAAEIVPVHPGLAQMKFLVQLKTLSAVVMVESAGCLALGAGSLGAGVLDVGVLGTGSLGAGVPGAEPQIAEVSGHRMLGACSWGSIW